MHPGLVPTRRIAPPLEVPVLAVLDGCGEKLTVLEAVAGCIVTVERNRLRGMKSGTSNRRFVEQHRTFGRENLFYERFEGIYHS